MKKRLSAFGIVLLCYLLFMAGTTGCTVLKTEHPFSDVAEITAQHVPEGTYYTDLLVQLPEKDRLRVADTGVRLAGTDLTEDSEIFRYCQDNYVSASLHYGYAESFVFPEQQNPQLLCTELHLSGDTKDGRFSKGKFFLDIPSFRIAYVSQDGKVLGVTNPAVAEPRLTPFQGIPFTADGSSAQYSYTTGENWSPVPILLFAELLLLLILVLPIYAVIAAVCRRREQKAVIARIQQNAAKADEEKTRPDE
ncbi:MAG: hypothetical protein J5722_02810 [Oscillospiraceae bacterium]|nr:hypothetical protein [Oscillospiraceae bacterium]